MECRDTTAEMPKPSQWSKNGIVETPAVTKPWTFHRTVADVGSVRLNERKETLILENGFRYEFLVVREGDLAGFGRRGPRFWRNTTPWYFKDLPRAHDGSILGSVGQNIAAVPRPFHIIHMNGPLADATSTEIQPPRFAPCIGPRSFQSDPRMFVELFVVCAMSMHRTAG